MEVANLNRKRKRRNRKGADGQRRSDNDPLQSFNDADVNLDGLEGDDEDMPDFSQGDEEQKDAKKRKQDATDKMVFTNSKDGTGKSTAGRNSWKEKHRKGEFSSKKRKSEMRKKKPMGI
jgi:hypothetical protein